MVVGQHTAACVLSVVISAVRIVMMISKMRLMVFFVLSFITRAPPPTRTLPPPSLLGRERND